MIQDRLNDKEHDLQGVQKQSSELLSIAWQKGYKAGFNDGYATRREAEIRPQGEWVTDDPTYSTWRCNKCLHVQTICTNFCPNCGAKMGGEEE